MPGAVAREKGDALSAERADDVRPGRIAKGRRDRDFAAVGDLGHVVQTAATDDAYLDLFHECFTTGT